MYNQQNVGLLWQGYNATPWAFFIRRVDRENERYETRIDIEETQRNERRRTNVSDVINEMKWNEMKLGWYYPALYTYRFNSISLISEG